MKGEIGNQEGFSIENFLVCGRVRLEAKLAPRLRFFLFVSASKTDERDCCVIPFVAAPRSHPRELVC